MNDIEIIGSDQVTWQEYRALRLEALRDAPQAFGASYENSVAQPDTFWQTRLADCVAARSNWMLFARADDHLVGMVAAYQDEEAVAEHLARIVAMYVTPSARGNGIAGQLVKALIAILERMPALERIELGVNPQQATALNLYERLGFVVVERERGRMGDGKEYDLLTMERHLG